MAVIISSDFFSHELATLSLLKDICMLDPNLNHDIPDVDLGRYMHELLNDSSWILRRVESIGFPHLAAAKRSITVDIDVDEVLLKQLVSTSLRSGSLRPVPIALLTKDLLVNFDYKDASGRVVSVVRREEDSYLAMCMLCHQATLVRPPLALDRAVQKKLYRIAHGFPEDPYDDDIQNIESWREDDDWGDKTRKIWRSLLKDAEFRSSLLDFTFNFMLLAGVSPQDSGTAVFKFSYEIPAEFTDLGFSEKLGLKPARYLVSTPGIWHARSYHLRFSAPEGLVPTNVYVGQVQPAGTPEGTSQRGLTKLTGTRVNLYASNFRREPGYRCLIELRAPLGGFFSYSVFSTIFTATVLSIGLLYLERLSSDSTEVGATVALLLAGPSLLAAYLSRPREHVMVGRVLRWIRYLVGASALLPYVAAGSMVLHYRSHLFALWIGLTILAWGAAVALITIMVRFQSDLKEARGAADQVVAAPVEVEYE